MKARRTHKEPTGRHGRTEQNGKKDYTTKPQQKVEAHNARLDGQRQKTQGRKAQAQGASARRKRKAQAQGASARRKRKAQAQGASA
ncbi:hypothetical protein AB0M36_20575, partial [Actinoplanes sp. NPDC051346]|uniref:hypothetical protein n=1 Tax=Actinoplanes sp. NPDC051346 TaxID=3155048 RepID=UPI0034182FF2